MSDLPADRPANQAIYTSRIIKASALIADTKVLLAEWDLGQTPAQNLDRARQGNIFGKGSRMRVEDVLIIFRQRYFDDGDVGAALVTLAQGGAPAAWLDPLLYFFAAQNDRVLRDIVIDVVQPRYESGFGDLPVAVVQRQIEIWAAEGKTTTRWGRGTIERVSRNVMAALRDFGVLTGKADKRIGQFALPVPAFAIAALWLRERARSGDLLLHSDDWRLFLLNTSAVERLFIEADQMHLLTYYAAGSVLRIDFPAANLTEYAHVLLERTR